MSVGNEYFLRNEILIVTKMLGKIEHKYEFILILNVTLEVIPKKKN